MSDGQTLGVAEATISLSRRSSTKGRPRNLASIEGGGDVSADVSLDLQTALKRVVLDNRTPTSSTTTTVVTSPLTPQIKVPLTPTDNVCVDFVFQTSPRVRRSIDTRMVNVEVMQADGEPAVVKVVKKVGRKYTRRLTSSLLRPALEDPRKGRNFQLDNFKWIKTIGTGTFGRVVLCEDTGALPEQEPKYFAMKILRIQDVFRLKQVEHIKDEKGILEKLDHPFIVKLFWSHHDNTNLYMLLEYAPGGELFTYLRSVGRFPAPTAMFYGAEILLALEYLHAKSIVYRDLKPENLIFDHKGHIRITDFGFAKELTDRTWTLCGTPEYLAPEIIQSRGYNKAVDYWAFGILVYEMLVGHPPFYSDNPIEVYQKILDGKIRWPKNFDLVAKDLIKKLLVADRTKRLGSMKNGVDDIKAHRWFWTINWQSCLDKEMEPPYNPHVAHPGDAGNFDDYPEDWRDNPGPPAPEEQRAVFQDF
ncbi:cAMP-dependent protein kinase catalytic subunit PRKX-like [Paramacrobiotus metropolitanus]|uniref:cAMP-dependent protein kinase catalytic subunit PRKX-like n=1 Tax=Paramacrobiotus metropolitanus TaxID=2943436 RepID=UPI002446275C|nr:cAMP-dependent protein kinase catalytic subunit PRKX-like [Paramacrobiotus metropolitanus]